MKSKHALILGAAASALCALVASGHARAEGSNDLVVRIAELEIDSAQLEAYKSLLKEEIETSTHIEPGVLTLYAVSIKNHPSQIRLFEIYRNQAAYLAHLQSPHFKKYKSQTKQMVKSLTLLETEPILLSKQ